MGTQEWGGHEGRPFPEPLKNTLLHDREYTQYRQTHNTHNQKKHNQNTAQSVDGPVSRVATKTKTQMDVQKVRMEEGEQGTDGIIVQGLAP
jgi:hypothetical protein